MHDTPWKYRGIHEHQDIQWIAILSAGGRHEAEVERKHGARRKYGLQHKCAEPRFKRELVGRAFRRFDHDNQAVVAVVRHETVERRGASGASAARGSRIGAPHRTVRSANAEPTAGD